MTLPLLALSYGRAAEAAAMPNSDTALTVLGTIVAAALALVGVVFAARASGRANARTVAVQERTAESTGMAALVKALQDELKRVSERVDVLERDRDDERRARIRAEEEAATERRLRADERRGRLEAVGAYRDVVEILVRVAPQVPVPDPPASVEALL